MATKAYPGDSKIVKLNDGTRYGYVHIAPTSKKQTLFFLHGFPSSSYDWRHQVTQFSKAGYGILAPDMLGYGDTDAPTEMEEYSMKRMAGHLDEILEREGLAKVVGIGHDWGSSMLSRVWNYHPHRFLGLVFLSVGYTPPGPRVDVGMSLPIFRISLLTSSDTINALTHEKLGYSLFGYWKFIAEPDAPSLMTNNLKCFSSLFYPSDPTTWKTDMGPVGGMRAWVEAGTIAPRPSWLTAEEDQIHEEIIAKVGYAAPVNWYRQQMANLDRAKEAQVAEDSKFISVPTLLVTASKDYIVLAATSEERTREWSRGELEIVRLDCGHWIQLELKEELGVVLQKWLDARDF